MGSPACLVDVPFFALSSTCSGNGECVLVDAELLPTVIPGAAARNLSLTDAVACECSAGWTGKSDWVSLQGLDCHINVTALQVLWAVNMLFYAGIVAWSLPRLREVWLRHVERLSSERSGRQKPASRLASPGRRGRDTAEDADAAMVAAATAAEARPRKASGHTRSRSGSGASGRGRSRSGGGVTIRVARATAVRVAENKAYLGVAIFLFIMFPGAMILGATEILGQRVGVDLAPTLGFIMVRSGFYVAGFLFQPYLLNVVVGIRRFEELRELTRHSWLNVTLLVVENVVGVAALVSVAWGDSSATLRRDTFVGFNAVMALCLCGLHVQARFVRSQIHKSLDQYTDGPRLDQDLRRLRNRLGRIQSSLIRSTAIQGTVFLLQAAVPFLWPVFSYILPLSYFIPGLATINVIKALRGTKKSPKWFTKNPSFAGNDPDANLDNLVPASPTTLAGVDEERSAVPVTLQGTAFHQDSDFSFGKAAEFASVSSDNDDPVHIADLEQQRQRAGSAARVEPDHQVHVHVMPDNPHLDPRHIAQRTHAPRRATRGGSVDAGPGRGIPSYDEAKL